jgi:hypothetical protein
MSDSENLVGALLADFVLIEFPNVALPRQQAPAAFRSSVRMADFKRAYAPSRRVWKITTLPCSLVPRSARDSGQPFESNHALR